MALAEFYQNWLEHNGKVVKINGILHILRVDHYEATYPYRHWTITVHAEVKDKSTKYYRDRKQEMGDDWSTDVLESDVTLQADILHQLENHEEAACTL